MRTLCLIVCACLFVVGCNENGMNKKVINVQGCVTDCINGTPVAGAKVTLLCWYHAGWDKTDYKSIDTIADKNGCFSARFEEGYKVAVASVAAQYHPNLRTSEELSSSDLEINLVLKKRMDSTDTSEPNINLQYYIVQNSSN